MEKVSKTDQKTSEKFSIWFGCVLRYSRKLLNILKERMLRKKTRKNMDTDGRRPDSRKIAFMLISAEDKSVWQTLIKTAILAGY